MELIKEMNKEEVSVYRGRAGGTKLNQARIWTGQREIKVYKT